MKSAHKTSKQAPQHAGFVTQKVPTFAELLLHNEEVKAAEQSEDHSNNERMNQTENNPFLCWSFQHLV